MANCPGVARVVGRNFGPSLTEESSMVCEGLVQNSISSYTTEEAKWQRIKDEVKI